MAKKNVLQDFAKFTVSESTCDTLKGGRSNNSIPINTGSYGFIDWGDVEIRNVGIVRKGSLSSYTIGKTVG